eukprot:GHVU01209846.1.p1 GENE.GHVU01209846.1~~GHVU01209846.1.p1  ORF type:complete len:111 (-),score=1.09 GHVU01209846.1:235-567(-)
MYTVPPKKTASRTTNTLTRGRCPTDSLSALTHSQPLEQADDRSRSIDGFVVIMEGAKTHARVRTWVLKHRLPIHRRDDISRRPPTHPTPADNTSTATAARAESTRALLKP